MNSDSPAVDVDELKRDHHRTRAPAGASTAALARFNDSQVRRNYWPALGLAAAVLFVAVLVPRVVQDDDLPAARDDFGAAGLSLNQLELPPRPELETITHLSASGLSMSTSLPLGVPNMSQLSAIRNEDKETI
jgi:hypothetical protein